MALVALWLAGLYRTWPCRLQCALIDHKQWFMGQGSIRVVFVVDSGGITE